MYSRRSLSYRRLRQAIPLPQNREYDAAIIDLDLPVNHGISILRFLRKRNQALPVLVLAGCASVAERIRVSIAAQTTLSKSVLLFPNFRRACAR
jgi:DNA-binding response OmpR family regulator